MVAVRTGPGGGPPRRSGHGDLRGTIHPWPWKSISSRSAPERRAVVSGVVADLDARDPELIRSQLPLMWLPTTIYFRADVKGSSASRRKGRCCSWPTIPGQLDAGLDRVHARLQHTFGVERPLYVLAHALVTTYPILGDLTKRWGIIKAGPQSAKAVLNRGHSVLVYPGGDVEVHRL